MTAAKDRRNGAACWMYFEIEIAFENPGILPKRTKSYPRKIARAKSQKLKVLSNSLWIRNSENGGGMDLSRYMYHRNLWKFNASDKSDSSAKKPFIN